MVSTSSPITQGVRLVSAALSHVIARAIYDAPGVRIIYTEAITRSSHFIARQHRGAALFLHPEHRPLVEAVRQERSTTCRTLPSQDPSRAV